MNENIYECLKTLEYVFKQQNLIKLLEPLDCIKKYITKLERENFGLKTTTLNQQESLQRQYIHVTGRNGKTSRR